LQVYQLSAREHQRNALEDTSNTRKEYSLISCSLWATALN